MSIKYEVKKILFCSSFLGGAFASTAEPLRHLPCPHSHGQQYVSFQAASTTSVPRSFQQAMQPVLVEEQIALTPENLEKSYDSEKVFALNLREVDFSGEQGEKILKAIGQQAFPNLRSIDLGGCKKIQKFLNSFFVDGRDVFSLVTLRAGDVEVMPDDISPIAKYYANCSHVLRDMVQYDIGSEMEVAILKIHVDKVSLFDGSNYRSGDVVNGHMPVFSRANQSFNDLPFFILVRR